MASPDFSCRQGDRVALGDQLAWLSTRPPAALEVAEVARHAVLEGHTMQRMVREYETLYESVLARRARAHSRSHALAGGSHG